MSLPSLKSLSLCCAGLGLVASAMAAKVPLYDDFNAGNGIDRAKWLETESVRMIDKGKLSLGRTTLGGTSGDTGTTDESFNLDMSSDAPAKTLKATITVTELWLSETCANNPTPSAAQARINGAYFNVRAGGPLPGDRTGDVLAQTRVRRASNSVDAPGVLQVQGLVVQCTNADCSTNTLIGTVQSLGSVNLGTAVVVQQTWDKKANSFTFTRDTQTPVVLTYAQSDQVGPSVPFNNLSIRNNVANCASGPRVKAGALASFDNIGLAP